ncbi:hypothetical protein MCOR30_011544 [Pyricularia oryzae]|nr:hypothetical protein MCOR30_011544 [Pyricularia oryzae]
MANLNSFLDDAPESIRSNKEVIAWLSEKLETLESEKKIERLEAEIKKLKGSRSNEENLRKQANEWKAKYERLHRAATIPKHEHSEDNAKLIEKTRQQLLKQYDEEIGRRAENEQRQAQQVIEQAKKIERLQAENAKYRQVLEKAKKQDFHPSAPSKATSASGNVYNDLTGYKTKSLTVSNEKQNGTPNNSRRTCSSVSNDIQGNAHAHAAVKLAISTLDAELPESYTKNSIDVESLQLPRRRPGLKVPQFEGSCEVRLGQMIDWGTQSFPKRKAEVRYFNADTFIGAGVFYQLCRMDSCRVIEFGKNLSITGKFRKHADTTIILCHVAAGNQLSLVQPDHFVVAIVDSGEKAVQHLQKKRVQEDRKLGSLSCWGMENALVNKLKTDLEQAWNLNLSVSQKERYDHISANILRKKATNTLFDYFTSSDCWRNGSVKKTSLARQKPRKTNFKAGLHQKSSRQLNHLPIPAYAGWHIGRFLARVANLCCFFQTLNNIGT